MIYIIIKIILYNKSYKLSRLGEKKSTPLTTTIEIIKIYWTYKHF